MKIGIKLIAILTLILFSVPPVFADGEDVTDTVVVAANTVNDNITKNVGNVSVTTVYEDGDAFGVVVSATDGKTATVIAKDVSVNAPDAEWQTGIDAQVIEDTVGHINVATQKITSGMDGARAGAYKEGSEVVFVINGDVQSGAFAKKDGTRSGLGIFGDAKNGGKVSYVVNGNIDAPSVGVYLNAVSVNEMDTDGKVNAEIHGDVNSSNGPGLEFAGKTNNVDVLVTGTINGALRGVHSNTYNWSVKGNNNLTVWKITSASGKLITKMDDYDQYEDDEDFAKKINYIIKYAANALLKKTDGSAIDTSHDFPVAKEGEVIIIDTPLNGQYVKKVFNNGVDVTVKDQDGNVYFIIPRGGGVDLTVETAPDQCPTNPKKNEPGVCGCEMADVDSDGDGAIDCQDGCPNDPRNNGIKPPAEGCFIDGSDIPERYDPKIKTDIVANPKTKVLPPFVLMDGNKANVYFERFAGGVVKVSDKKFATTKYELVIKTKNKKGLTKKTVTQALSNNVRKFNLKNGVTITVQYRVLITKKVGKKKVTKRTKMSKAVKLKL